MGEKTDHTGYCDLLCLIVLQMSFFFFGLGPFQCGTNGRIDTIEGKQIRSRGTRQILSTSFPFENKKCLDSKDPHMLDSI